MRGFLNTLITKSRAAAPMVRPRLPALFEPRESWHVPGGESATSNELESGSPLERTVEREHSPLQARPPGLPAPAQGEPAIREPAPLVWRQEAAGTPPGIPAAASEQPRAQLPIHAHERTRLPQPPLADHSGATAQSLMQPAQVPVPPASIQYQAEHSEQPAMRTMALASAPQLVERTVERVIIERAALESTPATRTSIVQPRLDGTTSWEPPRAPQSSVSPSPAEGLSERVIERTAVTERRMEPPVPSPIVPYQPPRSVIVQPQSVRRADQPRPPASEAMQPAQQPTIHVTIGRVEVRATQQASQPAGQRQTSTSAGLDAYLRRRSRGGGG